MKSVGFSPVRFLFVFVLWLAVFSALNFVLRRWVDTLGSVEWTIQAASKLILSPWFWIAACMYVTCAGLYALALLLVPLSTAGPIYLTAGVVATSLLGWGLFGEVITPLKALAIVVMCVGIGLLAIAGTQSAG
jgi:multidrug transporter EmrE-like cation transporter